MSFFKELDGDGAVLVENGVYKQVPLATRDGYLFAKVSGGYVRLMSDGSTSKGKMRLEFLSADHIARDPTGRLCLDSHPKARALARPDELKLLGGPEA